MIFRAAIFLLLPLAAAEFISIRSGEISVVDSATGFHVRVTLGAFELGRTEVTQTEFTRVMGKSPAYYKGPDRPADSISWFDAIAYLNRRSEMEQLVPCYALSTGGGKPGCTGYRLPTSAEWTLAAGVADASAFRSGGFRDTGLLIARQVEGSRPVGKGQPNPYGLYDMSGNVWEWCEDWFSPEPPLDSVRDPRGPPNGLARVIRGGSFLTGGTQWNKELLSSLAPQTRSRFTGFRIARTVSPTPKTPGPDAAWLAKFQQRPEAFKPLPVTRTTTEIRNLWLSVLGVPKLPARAPRAKAIGSFQDATWNAQLFDLAVEANFPTRILVTEPVRKPAGRLPVILVPYYDVDTPAGTNLGGRRFTPGGARAFARLAAQRGFLAVAIKWYGEADGESYDEAVWQLANRHPDVTPMGKWIWDLQRVIDYLVTRPDVDAARIGIIGHSLGGKMALYGAAFDSRIKVTVSSEPGIGLKLSNYQDFWYFGKAIEKLPKDSDQHELLALITPRPFLLIAGESADGDKSWPYLPAGPTFGLWNHRSGHSPNEESVLLAFEWLMRFL